MWAAVFCLMLGCVHSVFVVLLAAQRRRDGVFRYHCDPALPPIHRHFPRPQSMTEAFVIALEGSPVCCNVFVERLLTPIGKVFANGPDYPVPQLAQVVPGDGQVFRGCRS